MGGGHPKKPRGVAPENLTGLELPDAHSFVRTPTHKQPVTDYEGVREKAATQKRDVERALTRFIAKTGKTHSLFNETSNRESESSKNIFPLISCVDRNTPDQPVLPAYINALLFKDQIFEEEISPPIDPATPKKKKEDSEKRPQITVSPGEGEEPEDGAINDINSKETAKKKEKEAYSNPFMRPTRMPRSSGPLKRRLN